MVSGLSSSQMYRDAIRRSAWMQMYINKMQFNKCYLLLFVWFNLLFLNSLKRRVLKKKTLIILSSVIIIYTLGSNLPRGFYKIENENVIIKISITDNLLVIRDPECTKRIKIIDGSEEFKIKFWSELYEVKVFKRTNGKQSFWVVDDSMRGVTRTENGVFTEFTCWEPACSGGRMEGKNILSFEFKNNKWIKVN